MITFRNFAHLFWGYNCVSPRKLDDPYRFLGYLYYRVNMKPWLFDCAEAYECLIYAILSGENDFSHNPFVNNDYNPKQHRRSIDFICPVKAPVLSCVVSDSVICLL